MQRFTELRVWQLAHTLACDIYKLSASFPQSERFGSPPSFVVPHSQSHRTSRRVRSAEAEPTMPGF